MKQYLVLLIALLAVFPGGLAVAAELVLQDGQWVQVAEPVPGTAEGDIAMVRQAVEKGNYQSAIRQADTFIKAYPGDPQVEQAYYLSGEAELARGRYWQAFKRYEKQLDNFPNGTLFERTLTREVVIADAFLAGKKKVVWGIFVLPAQADGLKILERVAERFPGSSLAEQSLMKIGDYYYSRQMWVEAAEAYKHYQDVFGNRARGSQAELKAANATLNSYKGPQFDDTPLVEAEQRYKAFAARYPAEAGREHIETVLGGIESDKAQKDYDTARFYARVARPGPAAFYYRQVIALYPTTDYAQQSRQALLKMNLPPTAEPAAPAGAVNPTPTQPAPVAPAAPAAPAIESLEGLIPATGPVDEGTR